MAKQPVFLTYHFMFDASNTYQHMSQFEADLADFFSTKDKQARIIKTMGGQMGGRIMVIENVDMLEKARNKSTKVKRGLLKINK